LKRFVLEAFMFTTINIFFMTLILTLGGFLLLNKNPMYSIFTLVTLFIVSAGILVGYQIDFFGLLFIIVYIGAIAVLFLFIIMMLDLKENTNSKNILLTVLFIFFGTFVGLSTVCGLGLFESVFPPLSFSTPLLLPDAFFNINIFGLYFYLNFGILFLLGGLVLVVALIGAISLILNYNNNKTCTFFDKKLAKSNNYIIFFSSKQ
jgi:NADH-quinone oxidoreductase subunit J